MAYVNGIVRAIVDPAVVPPVFTEQQMPDVADAWVVVAQLPGGGTRVDPRFRRSRFLVQVDGYAKNSSKAAQALAQAAVEALVAAWRSQTVTPDGVIATVNDVRDPSPLPGPAQDIYRYMSTLQITVR